MPFVGSPLRVEQAGTRHWMLLAPLAYEGTTDRWIVPAGFLTDYASVPRFLQSFVQATGTWTLAAILHDWFCVRLALGDCPISPVDADGIFRRVLREEGVDPLRRWSMWAAVRWAALFNPRRRPGWLKTAPLVLLITALLLAAVGAAVIGLDSLAHWLIGH